MLFMDQLNVLLMDMVKYVIGFAPGGIFFMIAGAIANRCVELLHHFFKLTYSMQYVLDKYQLFTILRHPLNSDDFVDLLKNVGVLVMTVVLGLLFHVGFSLCSIFFCLTRLNPFRWLQKNTNQVSCGLRGAGGGSLSYHNHP